MIDAYRALSAKGRHVLIWPPTWFDGLKRHGAACATATSARFHEDMTVPDWFDPGQVDSVV